MTIHHFVNGWAIYWVPGSGRSWSKSLRGHHLRWGVLVISENVLSKVLISLFFPPKNVLCPLFSGGLLGETSKNQKVMPLVWINSWNDSGEVSSSLVFLDLVTFSYMEYKTVINHNRRESWALSLDPWSFRGSSLSVNHPKLITYKTQNSLEIPCESLKWSFFSPLHLLIQQASIKLSLPLLIKPFISAFSPLLGAFEDGGSDLIYTVHRRT